MNSRRLTAIITVVCACLLVLTMIMGVMPATVVDWRGGTLLLLVFGGVMLTTIEPISLPSSGLWSMVSVVLTLTSIVVGIINLTFGGRRLFLVLFFSLVSFWLIMFVTSIVHHYNNRQLD